MSIKQDEAADASENGHAVEEQLRRQLDEALSEAERLKKENAELETEVEAMSEELHMTSYYEKTAWRFAHALQQQMMSGASEYPATRE